MSKQVYIYALRCPINGDVRYVGATVSPESRLRQHMSLATAGRKKRQWIKAMMAAGVSPQMEILERVAESDRYDAESEWLHYFRRHGCDLVNEIYRGCKWWKRRK